MTTELSNALTDFFLENLSPGIDNVVRECKAGSEVTADNVAKWLGVPLKRGQVGLPAGFSAGTGTTRRTRRSAKVDSNGPKCQYVITRGKRSGQKCDKTCQNDPDIHGSDKYCKQCLTKSAVKRDLDGTDSNRSVSQAKFPANVVKPQASRPVAKRTLDCVPIPGHPDMFCVRDDTLLVRNDPGSGPVAIGTYEDGEIKLGLSPDDEAKAISMCLSVLAVSKDEDGEDGDGDDDGEDGGESSDVSVPHPQVPGVSSRSKYPPGMNIKSTGRGPQVPKVPQIHS